MTADDGDPATATVTMSACLVRDRLIITLAGELTVADSALEVDRWLTAQVRHVVVDVAELSFADVAGVRALLRVRRTCLGAGATFTLRRPGSYLRWLLDLTDTRRLLIADGAGRPA